MLSLYVGPEAVSATTPASAADEEPSILSFAIGAPAANSERADQLASDPGAIDTRVRGTGRQPIDWLWVTKFGSRVAVLSLSAALLAIPAARADDGASGPRDGSARPAAAAPVDSHWDDSDAGQNDNSSAGANSSRATANQNGSAQSAADVHRTRLQWLPYRPRPNSDGSPPAAENPSPRAVRQAAANDDDLSEAGRRDARQDDARGGSSNSSSAAGRGNPLRRDYRVVRAQQLSPTDVDPNADPFGDQSGRPGSGPPASAARQSLAPGDAPNLQTPPQSCTTRPPRYARAEQLPGPATTPPSNGFGQPGNGSGPATAPGPATNPSIPPESQSPRNVFGESLKSSTDNEGCGATQTNCNKELDWLAKHTVDKVNLDIADHGAPGDDYPCECRIVGGQFEPRCWPLITYTWKASALCHKPLYFEEVQLERYGHSPGPYVDAISSAAHFFVTIPLLPYYMGVDPPWECQYSLGYYRPGSCAPYMIEPFPLSFRGALIEGGAAVGAAAAIP